MFILFLKTILFQLCIMTYINNLLGKDLRNLFYVAQNTFYYFFNILIGQWNIIYNRIYLK